ncbi:MerC domain-containing protein [Sphingobium sp. AS12]|uniref:MerC domain-containing protein n=1 Tax=Sphingobium sp. AS12 TaxID=2849495 RepID=UPI001C31B3AE|nr:MerC domain-containing protein [Sphingobium sp. AS12]MBV2150975.1 MerC domain-containing protein [Sphingobium sp. AS12]
MSQSLRHFLLSGRLDRFAIALSGLCLAHCFVTAVVLGLLAMAGGIFESPIFHEAGLVLAILLGAIALGHGAMVHRFMMPAAIGSLGLGVMAGALTMDHGWQESVYTLIGVGILALGHDLNHRAGR